MTTQQRQAFSLKVKEEIDEISTQAESIVDTQKVSLTCEAGLVASKALEKAIVHH